MQTSGQGSMRVQNGSCLRPGKSLPGKNSIFINSLEEIKKLKNQSEEQGSKSSDIQVWGSGELVQLLFKNDLVDELRLKIHPLTLGKGKKLFGDGVIPSAFELFESIVTPKGVIIVTYKRPDSSQERTVKTGTVKA